MLLHRQRPCVQQRRFFRGAAEIAAMPREMEVAGEQHRRRGAQAKRAIVQRQQDLAAGDDGDGDGREQGGEYPADAPHIEIGEAEPAFRQLPRNDRGDQIAGDDEEDVDANETSGKGPEADMIEQHRQHRQCAQPIDVAPIGNGRAGLQRGRRGQGRTGCAGGDAFPPLFRDLAGADGDRACLDRRIGASGQPPGSKVLGGWLEDARKGRAREARLVRSVSRRRHAPPLNATAGRRSPSW